jgi:two-component system, NtrC family, sensor histidine kinase HupT/HoxJ
LKYSIRNSGFFSKQSFLILIGTSIPLILNALGTFKVINMTTYLTPVSFSIGLGFYSLSIFKFNFLSVTPIALQKIVDRISDSYIVLNDNNVVTDFNKTFLHTFLIDPSTFRNVNILSFLKANTKEVDLQLLEKVLNNVKTSSKTIYLKQYFKYIDKHFNVEINIISSKSTYLGTVILFKDNTQHIKDLETIKNNQNILIEKERLASLGQMIGRYST